MISQKRKRKENLKFETSELVMSVLFINNTMDLSQNYSKIFSNPCMSKMNIDELSIKTNLQDYLPNGKNAISTSYLQSSSSVSPAIQLYLQNYFQKIKAYLEHKIPQQPVIEIVFLLILSPRLIQLCSQSTIKF